jgi:exosortase
MSLINLSRSPKQTNVEVDVLQTLWDQRPSTAKLLAIGAATLVLVLAYAPNFRVLITFWQVDPNYSHGFLVVPIALFILWQQLATPEPNTSSVVVPAPWWGWVFLTAVLAVRAIAYEWNSSWLETATILPAIAALTWSFGSWPLLRRIWPAIAYLVFMLPLPQLVNNWLALPLQLMAASSSRFLLQLTGMWVIQAGNVINLSAPHGRMEQLDVALACNGLRMLMTMAATVTATIILIPLPTWKRITLLLSVVPIALVSNMVRIVATGWCYYLITDSTARHWAHDLSGWLMMPLALLLVGLELGVLSWLVPKESEDDKPVIPLLNMTKNDFGKQKKKNQDLGEI